MTRSAATRLRHAEGGQMLVLGAGFFAILLVFLGVALYFGEHMTQRRNLQNIADAAAMAGAQELDGTSDSEDPAIARAQEYIDTHVDDLDEAPVITVGDNYTSIRVTVRRSPGFTFNVFGLGDETIGGRAKAMIASSVLPGPGVIPIAIDEATYDLCIEDGDCEGVTLKEYSGNNDDPPSSYGLLDFESGAQAVCEYLIAGSPYPITDPTFEENGNVSSLHNCLVTRMDAAEDNNCLTIDQVLDDNGALEPRCNPLDEASRVLIDGEWVQPTAVVLIPVIQSFENEVGCDDGPQCLDIIGDGEDLRTFAFFLVDLSTVETVGGVGPTCAPPGSGGGGGGNGNGGGPGGGSGQCHITGQFLDTWLASVAVNDGGTIPFDPESSLIKVIRLVE